MALTYIQSATLMADPTYRGLVTVALVISANAILAEAATVPAHNARVAWAQQTLRGPQQAAIQLIPACVMQTNTQAAGLTSTTPPTSAVTDANLQTDLQAVVDSLIG